MHIVVVIHQMQCRNIGCIQCQGYETPLAGPGHFFQSRCIQLGDDDIAPGIFDHTLPGGNGGALHSTHAQHRNTITVLGRLTRRFHAGSGVHAIRD